MFRVCIKFKKENNLTSRLRNKLLEIKQEHCFS